MANFKADVQIKLQDQEKNVLKDSPEFLKTYIRNYLPSQSNELRSHIAYAKDINLFLKFYSTQLDKSMLSLIPNDLNNVTYNTLTDFFEYLTGYDTTYITPKGLVKEVHRTNSLASKARKLAALKKFYEYLVNMNLVKNNPTKTYKIPKPRISKINNRLDSYEILEIENSITSGTKNMSTKELESYKRLKLRDLTIFLILSSIGLRISELVSLDIDDVNIKKCTIEVTRKNNKIQELPYPNDISNCLEIYLKYRESITHKISSKEYKKALFLSQRNTRISDQAVRILLKKYCSRLDISDVSCHTLRRTCLSAFYNMSKDIRMTAKMGGHTVETASRYYADVEEERFRDEIRNFSYRKH